MAALPPAKALLETEAACKGDCFASATSSQIYPEPNTSWPPRANWTCLPGHKPCLDVSMFPPFVPLPTTGLGGTWIPGGSGTLDEEDEEESVAEAFAAGFTHGIHLLHTRERLPALIQALHTPHTSYSTCRPCYAHTASNTGILCCLQCREELLIFLFFFFFCMFRKAKAEQRFPTRTFRAAQAPWQHHKETMISLPPLQKHERLPCPACHGSNAAGITSFSRCLQSSYQEYWAGPFMQAGAERREQTCFDFLLPELAALDGGKERDSGGKMEECLPGISRRERTEADFDTKSGRERERKQDQAQRKVAGVFGAFCKYNLSYQL